MKKTINKFFVSLLFVVSLVNLAYAEQSSDIKTATLFVEKMTCAVCPITVKAALKKLDGVIDATSELKTKTATVTFNSQKVSIKELITATTNAGYPSSLMNDGAN